MNSANIVGRITKDPEPKKTATGKTMLTFCVAVDDRVGENKTSYFIDCQAWNKTAEFISRYFHKGDPIAVSGKIITRSWETEDGRKIKATEVLTNEVGFVPGASGGAKTQEKPNAKPQATTAATAPEDIMDLFGDEEGTVAF